MALATRPGLDQIAAEMVPYATIVLADFRVGRILTARRIPEARQPLYDLLIDVGWRRPEVRTVISAISGLETPAEQLPGQLVIVGCFVQPKCILGRESTGLLLTAYADAEHRTGSMPIPAPAGVPVGSPVR